MRSFAVVAALAGVATADSAPDPEIVPHPGKVDLPAVPAFDIVRGSDDAHGVKELRVAGAKLLDTKLTARGYVVWIYDCVTANQKPKESKADAQKRIDDDPTLCERPKFYLGDTKDADPGRALWVVDVPRLPNKLERERIKKPDLDQMYPPDRVPKLAVGDYVAVTGDFKLRSVHAEANSDGLLDYGSLAHQSPPKASAPPAAEPAPAPMKIERITPKPASAPPETADSPASRKHVNEGNRALRNKQYDVAIDEYGKATALWPDNALAWYGLGAAHAYRSEWSEARDAFRHAVSIAPDVAMYEQWAGVADYESAIASAREDEAKREGRDPKDVKPALAAINFEKAEQHLIHALQLEPHLWRARYYLGRIYRDGGKARYAAEQLTQAIADNPTASGPYVALCVLYERWDYVDPAIQVGLQGAANVTAATDVSDIWLVTGLAYDDKQMTREAIEAYDKAIKARPSNAKAVFQRGQDEYRSGDYASAKRDLEDFVKSAGNLDFAAQQANNMLMDLAAKKP